MSEVVVMARGTIKPDRVEEARAAFMACVKETHLEDGCIRYALHQGIDDRNVLVMIERWSSRGALDQHLASSHVQTLFAALADVLAAPAEILVLEPLSDATGEKGSIR